MPTTQTLAVEASPRSLPACCAAHDGPHLHRCSRPRTASGRTHGGACVLPAQTEAVTR